MEKIIQVSTAIAVDMNGIEIKRTICVTESGRAYELQGKKWVKLPEVTE